MIKKIKHTRNEEGFSLLELVVAVGILLVLTVGGLLAYNGITKNARVAAVQSAADEVYTGAVAYDSNGQDYKEAVKEWMETRNGDSITVEVGEKNLDGSFCVVAKMAEHSDITASRGSGCEGSTGAPGDGEHGSGEETTPPVIETPATAALCFEFNAGTGTITDYKEELDECGTDVVIPETIENQAVVHIGDSAFYENKLTSVEFPSSLKTIARGAFARNQLTSVEFNEGLETIGEDSLVGWQGGLPTFAGAFNGNKLTSVVIPDSVKTINRDAFSSNQLTSIDLGSGVETIGEAAFYNNHQFTSVFIPDSVKTIGARAFLHNISLTSVSIHGSTSSAHNSFPATRINPDLVITIR